MAVPTNDGRTVGFGSQALPVATGRTCSARRTSPRRARLAFADRRSGLRRLTDHEPVGVDDLASPSPCGIFRQREEHTSALDRVLGLLKVQAQDIGHDHSGGDVVVVVAGVLSAAASAAAACSAASASRPS